MMKKPKLNHERFEVNDILILSRFGNWTTSSSLSISAIPREVSVATLTSVKSKVSHNPNL